MHSYVEVLKRLLDSFEQIHSLKDVHIRFDEGFLTKADPEEMSGDPEYPIPVDLYLYDFNDDQGHPGSVEICFKKDTGELVHVRIAEFFRDFETKGRFFREQVKPFLLERFTPIKNKTHPELPVEEYHEDGLAIGLNNNQDLPLISTYITREGFQ